MTFDNSPHAEDRPLNSEASPKNGFDKFTRIYRILRVLAMFIGGLFICFYGITTDDNSIALIVVGVGLAIIALIGFKQLFDES